MVPFRLKSLSVIALFFALAVAFGAHHAHAAGGTSRALIKNLTFLNPTKEPVERSEFYFELEHDERFDLTRRRGKKLYRTPWSLQFHPVAYGTSVQGNRRSQAIVDPRAIYVEYLRRETWVRFGFMTMRWEGTDGLNPMDIASMKDWSDPLNSQTRASGALALGRSGENYDFEIAYIPYQTRSLLPGEKSAWLPRDATFPVRTDEFELLLPADVSYRYGQSEELDRARYHNYASRLQYRTDYGDLAVAYYEGQADTPAIVPTLDVVPIQVSPKQIFQLLSPIEVTPVYYRVRTTAGFYSKTFGETIFRAATRYDQPLGEDEDLPSWSHNAVAGFEKSFEVGPNTVTGLIQGAWTHIPGGTSLISVRDVFSRTVLLGLRYPIGENWTVMASGFKTLRDSSYFAKLEVSRRITDHLKIDAAVEALDGPSDKLMGVYGANDRASLGLTGAF